MGRCLLLISFAVLFAAKAFGDACPLVTVREEVMPVRDGRDKWIADWNASFVYTNGEGHVLFKDNKFCLYHRWDYPGGERVRGAAEYVVKIDPQLEGEAELDVRRERKGWSKSFKAKIGRETHFVADLPFDGEAYYLGAIKFCLKGDPPTRSVRFLGIDAVTRETPASVLRVDVETGNPFRLVRDGTGEKAELVLRNPSDRKLDWKVHLKVEDYFGNCREGDFPVSLEAGGVLRRPMKEVLPKGIRYVTVIAESCGLTATNRTTWAYVDAQKVTPFQPEGEFRLGVNFHGLRYTRFDSDLGMDVLVAIGAKMVRNEATPFPGIWQAENKIDWKTYDDYLDRLERHGLALDSIVWWPASWAVRKDADGKPVQGAIRPGLLRRFGEMLGQRYGKRIAYYEVGNEWDMSSEKWLPYEDAVRQVREFAEGLRSTCPTAKIIPCGFAAESSVRHPSNVIRPMFHENLMRDVQDVVDAHPCHLHGPSKEYQLKVRNFIEWRERMNVRIPWYANETAFSMASMRPDDRQMAVTMWQKVLFAWSRGSLDYIWYNLRATGWNPADSEQGYGMFTADWHPRTAAASFAALASTFRHQQFDGIAFDGKSRQVLRFKNAQGGSVRVIAGWDDFAERPMSVRIRTDAAKAWQVDIMGNRTPVSVKDGCTVWQISKDPSALLLEEAGFADPVAEDAKNAAKRPVKVIRPGSALGNKNSADFCLKEYEQVYEVYKAMPEHADRTWKWWGDLWAWINTAFADGRLQIKITCWDNVHHPLPDDPLRGDCAVLRLGEWKLALVASENPFVKVLARPAGVADPPREACDLKRLPGGDTVYVLSVDPKTLGLQREIPFNVRVYDNDGECFKSWIEFSPLDDDPVAVIRLPK